MAGITIIVLRSEGIPSFNSSLGKRAGFFRLHTIQFTRLTAISDEGIITTNPMNGTNSVRGRLNTPADTDKVIV